MSSSGGNMGSGSAPAHLTRLTDDTFMRLAIDEARKGSPSPNPHVGAVVVDAQGRMIGSGFHPRVGREHAEFLAIRRAGEAARGATLYVTLEPCNHVGRTPPCTEAVLAAGLSRVVVGVRDPDPRVRGGGNARLRAAGVEVVEIDGALAHACARLVAPFAKHSRTGRPYVRLKLAASLDGRIAAPGGASRWITGVEARRRVHALRARVDAVAVGANTALADDPDLTPRDADAIEARDPPIRLVFDSQARLEERLRLVQTARTAPTWVIAADDAPSAGVARLEGCGVRVLRAPRAKDGRGVDLGAALGQIGSEGIVDLLVEGGAYLAGALVQQDLVDEIIWYIAPIALGHEGAAALIGPVPLTPDVAPRYDLDALERVGDDVELVLLRRER